MATEKRLIDAKEVYEKGHRTPFHIGIADLCDLKELLEDVPTVDAVEVVRCKDCKKSRKSKTSLDLCWCNRFRNVMRKTDFCSFGEREGNGKTD